ncbi:sensor domain-containing phosphodiesterase [Halomonas sp. MA07-2]|uniref:sensor domain-containing phosphodiesterase n=1 Tax=Halomonas sp. MA07-2 TaxID=3440841 RepID=UPI003EE95060
MNDQFTLLKAQQGIHELIAQRAPLLQTLDAIARWMGLLLPEANVAFMRYDARDCTLSLFPSQSFSKSYTDKLQRVPVASDVASFGTAAHDRCLVITQDIALDPRWSHFRDAALAEGFRACWSSPVLGPDGELLGTFGTYYLTTRVPSREDQQSLLQASALISLALVHDRDDRSHRELSEWYRSLFVNHPDGVYEFDLEGRFQRGNAALARITGYSEADLIGLHFNELIEPDYHELTEQGFDAARRGNAMTCETRGAHADGHAYDLEITNLLVTLDGEVVGVYGICRDVTERNRQTGALRLLSRGVDASPSGMLMVDALDPEMPIVFANPAFTTMTGYSRDEVIGRNCRFLQGPNTDSPAVDEIRAGIHEQRDVGVTLLNYCKDGTPFWNRLVISPVFDDSGICTHFIGIQQDITQQKTQEAHIAYQATHDQLTGLPNRTAFAGLLEEAFQSSYKNAELLAVMYLDLDGFKTINDALGHHIGNQVLVSVARRLESLLNAIGVVAHLVGDEFGILLANFGDRAQVIELADRILDSLAQPIEVNDQQIQLSVSIGIACNSLPLEQSHEFVQHADLALEQAKRQGRNTWQWYCGSRAESTRHSVIMRHELHKALCEDQFEVHYQPVVDALNGRMRSVEALVRWRHPTRGMISPGEFIPLAEQTGQIIPLGRWVLHQACRDIAELFANMGRELPVAVNISSLQFCRDGFLEEVQNALDLSGLPPELLELEVTESVLLDGAEPVIELMETLKTMGVRVALDDFGTGFSSLSYLRDLPTHKLKLDRSFVQKAPHDRHTAAIVQGVITMAHHMDMIVVGEGVETLEEQQDMVRRHCDLLQGYLFSRPLPLYDLIALPEYLPAYA